MRKYYNGRKNRIVVFSLICSMPFLCGSGLFGDNKVMLDTKQNVVYQNTDANTVADAFSQNKSLAKDKYDDQFLLLYGKVISIEENCKELVIARSGKAEITCETSDKSIIEDIRSQSLKSGDYVRVYGRVDADLFGSGVEFDIDKVEKCESSGTSDTVYSTKNGLSYDYNSLVKKKIPDTPISLYIPPEWDKVEHNIKGEELGSVNGYQYRLNEVEPKKAYAESLFVCYFDKKYVNINDHDKNKLIEEAIIRDIFKEDSVKNKFPFRKDETYYGEKYIYYSDTYTKNGVDKYNAELIFQEEEDGIVMFLYIFHPGEADHIDDVMFTMRFLEVNNT